MDEQNVALAKKNMELSFEFSRLLLAQPHLAAEVPENALISFEVEKDPEITAYNRQMSAAIREHGQPLLIVHIKDLAPSRLIQPELRPAA